MRDQLLGNNHLLQTAEVEGIDDVFDSKHRYKLIDHLKGSALIQSSPLPQPGIHSSDILRSILRRVLLELRQAGPLTQGPGVYGLQPHQARPSPFDLLRYLACPVLQAGKLIRKPQSRHSLIRELIVAHTTQPYGDLLTIVNRRFMRRQGDRITNEPLPGFPLTARLNSTKSLVGHKILPRVPRRLLVPLKKEIKLASILPQR